MTVWQSITTIDAFRFNTDDPPLGVSQIGRVGHDGHSAFDEPVDGLGHLGFVLRLEHHAVAAAQTAERVDHLSDER